jgi:hypothetical protein
MVQHSKRTPGRHARLRRPSRALRILPALVACAALAVGCGNVSGQLRAAQGSTR